MSDTKGEGRWPDGVSAGGGYLGSRPAASRLKSCSGEPKLGRKGGEGEVNEWKKIELLNEKRGLVIRKRAVAEAGSIEGAIRLLERLREAEQAIRSVALQAIWETPSMKAAIALLNKLSKDGEAIALLAKLRIEAQSV
jgi:hypothetical protein